MKTQYLTHYHRGIRSDLVQDCGSERDVSDARRSLPNCRYGVPKPPDFSRGLPSKRSGSQGKFCPVFHILYRLGRNGITDVARVFMERNQGGRKRILFGIFFWYVAQLLLWALHRVMCDFNGNGRDSMKGNNMLIQYSFYYELSCFMEFLRLIFKRAGIVIAAVIVLGTLQPRNANTDQWMAGVTLRCKFYTLGQKGLDCVLILLIFVVLR